MRSPFRRAGHASPLGGGFGPCSTALAGQPRRPRCPLDDQGFSVERGVPRPVHLAAGERLCQHLDQLGGQLHLGGGALAAPEPEQYRQRHRRGAEPQPHYDRGHHPGVAVRGLLPCADPS